MSPAAHLQATIDLLQEVGSAARPADAVTSNWFRRRRDIGEEDRGQILDLFYALLRHQARLGWWLARSEVEDSARNRLVAWLGLNGWASRIDSLFSGGRDAPHPLSGRERVLLGKFKGATLHHPDMPEAVRLECPDWAIEPLRRRFGAGFAAELEAMLGEPPLDLRVNPLKSSREEMLGSLRDLGLGAEATPLSPLGIRLPERLSLNRLPMLKGGALEIQDEGSQLVALLLEAQPGDRVVDFCAGAGGKSLAIAAQMVNRGHLVACDVNEVRLKRGAERFRKAGLHNIETRHLLGETDKWVKRHREGFDRVLVDAPCSGTGTWRRNPDARWRPPGEQGVEGLVALQGRILASAARLVKPGGRLVYATCSLLPEENEEQVARFLSARDDFHVTPLPEAYRRLSEPGSDHLSLTPARHGTDGFFAAVLQRRTPGEVPAH